MEPIKSAKGRAEKIAKHVWPDMMPSCCGPKVLSFIAAEITEAVEEAEREALVKERTQTKVYMDQAFLNGYKAGAEAAAKALEAQADSNTSEMQLARLAELIRALKTPEGGKSHDQ